MMRHDARFLDDRKCHGVCCSCTFCILFGPDSLYTSIDLPPGCKSVSWGLHFSSTTRCYAARPSHFQRLPTWHCQQVVDCIWMTSEGSPFGRNRKDTRSKLTIQSTPARHKEYFINLCLVQFPKNTSMKACSLFFWRG